MPKAGITYGPRIKAPNYDQIDKDAEQKVLEDLGLKRPEDLVAKARPDALVVKAARIIEQADAELALHLDERDEALAHLWFYEQRLGLSGTAGLTNMGYRHALARLMFGDKRHPLPNGTNAELVQAAEEAGIKRVADAEEKLLKAAPIVYAARARREIAVRYMQEAVLALSQEPYGWKPEQIAEHAGVHRDLIYKQRAAARKRHGQ
ncbi:hypothetical protein IM697_18435 [Streptomyces ferrugineus]|uniref:Uncharacterized protein n=1 Tax=Streptomyces ferrugineus TaxID=1413221 RepID=A0A7M2SV24_9ACTN|nr:hypothetical protein [Streptomyces ferrugineus]QOV40200.1 hypothetical protein IM697_18435 [Streptomyces ferrugineus]